MSDLAPVLKALKSPLEPERKRAIQTLVKSRDVRAVELLQRVASTDESVAIRYLAKKAIYYLRKQLGIGDLSPDGDTGSTQSLFPAAKLKAILEGDDGDAKLRLLQALSRRKVASALPTLLEYDATGDSPEVRSTMVLVIGILGGEDELKVIKDYLRDEDPRVRANAIEAIEYLGTPKGYPLVVKALGDADNRIRANAIKALRSYGKVNCLALLQRMMESGKVWMRDSAAHALAFLGGAEGLPLLLAGLRDEEPSVREKARKGLERLADKGVRDAAEALAEFEDTPPGKQTIETFLEGRDLPDTFFAGDEEDDSEEDPLTSDDPKERIRGVDEIIETGDQSRRGPLLEAARAEGDTYVRAKMLIGLGRVGDRTTVELLLPFLDDEADRVRANAVEALTMADTEAAQPYLVPLLQDPNNRVRANAVIALKDYQAVDVTPTLEAMVADEAPLMRRSAFYAITDVATPKANALIARLIDDPDETLRSKVASYIEMCADDGDVWAQELRDGRAAAGEAPLEGDDFAEFAGGPEDLPSSGSSRDESATEARQMLKNFRAQDRDGKLAMIARARDDVCLESYFFLREVLEEEDFEIKVQAKMALRVFDEETFADAAGATAEFTALLKPPEVSVCDYKGVKQATELGKELNQRSQAADSRGYWEGPFPDRLVMLNALREDTLDMLQEALQGEEVQEAFLCYNSDRLEPFRTGRKPLDSNRYANLVSLVPQVNRTTSDTFHGSLLHSVKRPAYLLALMLETRLLLFLRGSLQSTICSTVSVAWQVIDRAEANRVGAGTTVSIEAMGVLVEVPELHGEDARTIYERAHAREQSKMNHALENLSTTKEFRRIDLLLQGGVITQEEYEKRKALLDKQRKG